MHHLALPDNKVDVINSSHEDTPVFVLVSGMIASAPDNTFRRQYEYDWTQGIAVKVLLIVHVELKAKGGSLRSLLKINIRYVFVLDTLIAKEILQVNKVMSIFFYVIFLTYLRGIQSTNMDQRSLPEDSINSLIIKLIQADILKNKLSKQMVDIKENYQNTVQKEDTQQDMDGDENVKSDFQPVISMDTDLLRQQRRYNSPRVLLSDNTPLEPPPLYLMEDYIGNSVVVNRTSRRKRYAEHRSHRGEYSVCDSESLWVTDKSSAIDIRGHQVTVLGEIKTGNSPVKQYFYETRCKEAKPVKNGCRGIDDKHWNSQCKTSQTYVRALTSENNKLVGWRWIRIDTSCVCALSRKIGRT
ncbi:Ntf3 [Columba livia]|nr:Ntf3 [Columba livia]